MEFGSIADSILKLPAGRSSIDPKSDLAATESVARYMINASAAEREQVRSLVESIPDLRATLSSVINRVIRQIDDEVDPRESCRRNLGAIAAFRDVDYDVICLVADAVRFAEKQNVCDTDALLLEATALTGDTVSEKSLGYLLSHIKQYAAYLTNLPMRKILEYQSAQELADAAGAHFVSSIPPRGQFYVALSGGRIAKPFYDSIVKMVRAESRNIDHIHFFFADERCVPPSDPESNFLTARQSLFEPLQIRAEQIHRIHGETEDSYAVQEAEAELCRIAPLSPDGQPILDLVILGMGEDGHTASLFPGESPTLIHDESVFRAVTAVKPPPRRITLGYAPLRAAHQLIVLASGKGKEAILRQVLSEIKTNAPTLPLARILNGHPNLILFTDVPNLSI